jgi:hypothetical protein
MKDSSDFGLVSKVRQKQLFAAYHAALVVVMQGEASQFLDLV